MTAAHAHLEAPSPPPPCPVCGGVMGDGDRVMYGTCSVCHLVGRRPAAQTRSARCWCGRKIATLPGGNGIECAEHDDEIPDTAGGPSQPSTPGGVFAAAHECPRCYQRMVDHDLAAGGPICPPAL